MAEQGGGDAPEVVDAFVAGDEAALAEIYTRWSSLVYSVALRSLGDVTDAEAVTQRVFAHAWVSRDDLRSCRGKLATWLIEITRRELAAAHAAPSHPVQRPQGTTLTRGCDEIEPSVLADRLLVADELSRLGDVPQQALRLALTEGLTHTQIAERMHLTTAQVKRHLDGSLQALRVRLAVLHGAH